jgi:hypothetical protein
VRGNIEFLLSELADRPNLQTGAGGMSESAESTSLTEPEAREALLMRALTGGLSDEEKKLRDREVIEQAQKYFGGLSSRERELLGLGSAAASTGEGAIVPDAVRAPSDFTLEEAVATAAAEPRQIGGIQDWVWAALSLIAFSGILFWVMRAH